MRFTAVVLLIFCTFLVSAAEVVGVPLIALRFDRAGHENMIWLENRVKLGDRRVNGYIQATGGRDEAIIGWELKDKWDALDAVIGYISGAPEGRTCTFSVEADGRTVFKSDPIHSKGDSEKIRVPLNGAKKLLLRVTGDRYNETEGAAFGAPTLLRGLSADDLTPPLKVIIDGKSNTIIPPGGVMPKTIAVPVPMKPGEHEYTVKVKYDEDKRRTEVTTNPGEPIPSVIE